MAEQHRQQQLDLEIEQEAREELEHYRMLGYPVDNIQESQIKDAYYQNLLTTRDLVGPYGERYDISDERVAKSVWRSTIIGFLNASTQQPAPVAPPAVQPPVSVPGVVPGQPAVPGAVVAPPALPKAPVPPGGVPHGVPQQPWSNLGTVEKGSVPQSQIMSQI